MIRFEVRVTGASAVVRDLEKNLPQHALQRVTGVIHALGIAIENKVKLEKLNGQILRRRSGRLVRSINTHFTDTSTSSTAAVGTSVRYGKIWELTGSREFRIVPRKGQALFWPGAAHPVRSVLHPAQAPRPFLKPTLEEMRPTIRSMIDRALEGLDRSL